MTKPYVKQIEDLIQEWGTTLSDQEYVDALEEMQDRAETALAAHEEGEDVSDE